MEVLVWPAAWLFAFLAAAPVLTLFHELAHACAALLRTDARVRVRVGREPSLLSLAVGRLSLALHPVPGWLGFYWLDIGTLSRARRLLVTLAGPFASLLVALALAFLAARLDDPWRAFAIATGWWVAFQFLVTAVPMRYPRWWGEYACLATACERSTSSGDRLSPQARRPPARQPRS